VLSLSGHGHDLTGAVLTLTGRVQEHRRRPEVVVRLLSAADLPDLLARHAELFEGLAFPDACAVHNHLLAGDYSSQLGLTLGFLGLAEASLALGLHFTLDGA
jgi:hypothetical protein